MYMLLTVFWTNLEKKKRLQEGDGWWSALWKTLNRLIKASVSHINEADMKS